MKEKDEVMDILRSSLSELKGFGVKRIGVFGSYARGDPDGESDIDILVEFEKGEERFENLFNVHELLKDRYDMNIDLVTIDGLSPYIGPHILEEVIFVDKAPA